MKIAFTVLLVLIVIDSFYSTKQGYNKKLTFWKVFQNACSFFIPMVLVWLGINQALAGNIIVSGLLIGFGVLMGSALLIVGLKQRKK